MDNIIVSTRRMSSLYWRDLSFSEFFHSIPFIQNLDVLSIKTLEASTIIESYAANQIIINEGNVMKSIYLIRNGSVKVSTTSRNVLKTSETIDILQR